MRPAGPDAVVVGLSVESSQTLLRRRHIADQDRQRTWKFAILVFAEQLFYRLEAGVLVAMQQGGHKQGLGATAREVNQRWRAQQIGEFSGTGIKQTIRDGVAYTQGQSFRHQCDQQSREVRRATLARAAYNPAFPITKAKATIA